jgi:membrane dipeptidase
MRSQLLTLSLLCLFASNLLAEDKLPPVSERAKKVHAAGFVFDGHNDLPWRLREDGDIKFERLDISKRLDSGQTDIPRAREGGLKAQFWSVYIPSEQANPARTVTEQIDIVHRMIAKYPNDLELALDADDVERIMKKGKIASLIGIEGGVAIENDLAQLRAFAKLGARYMTLTHNVTLPWADAATDTAKHGGLTPFGERIVLEMNRLGMLVDISHVSPETMGDALRVSKAPIIASHSSARAICDHPRNVPDAILKQMPKNGGVIMVNFYSGFIVPEAAKTALELRRKLREMYPNPVDYEAHRTEYLKAHPLPRGSISLVVDHIDHLVKVAGVDHVGIGSDFDGITAWPVGLDDVSCYPRLTEEMLKRGYSETDIHKILGGNVLRAFRKAGDVAKELQKSTQPDVVQPPIAPKH